eukprot:gene726-1191_t
MEADLTFSHLDVAAFDLSLQADVYLVVSNAALSENMYIISINDGSAVLGIQILWYQRHIDAGADPPSFVWAMYDQPEVFFQSHEVSCGVLGSGLAKCGACPEGFRGDGIGAEGCVPEDQCTSNNGGCHYLTACYDGVVASYEAALEDTASLFAGTEVLTSRYVKVHVLRLEAAVSADSAKGVGGGPGQSLLVEYEFRNTDPKTFDVGFVQSVRGAVARAFSLNMENATTASATRETPYPAVAVTLEVPGPAADPTCGPCPDGYQGSGVTSCRLTGNSCDVDNGGCWTTNGAEYTTCIVNAEGVTECGLCPFGYQGDGDQVGLSYAVSLWAWMKGNPLVTSRSNLQHRRRLFAETAALSTSTLNFYVESLPIVIVISGGDIVAGSGNTITLDATLSYDPDVWSEHVMGACLRAYLTAQYRRGEANDLQSYINYTFTVWASKGARESVERTSVRIMQGTTPVPSLTTVLGKVNPTEKFSTRAKVQTAYPESLTMDWRISTDDPNAAVGLDNTTLLTTTDQADIVLRPHVLHAGSTYTLTLAVRDKIGPASASMQLQVNMPPALGGVVVQPADAVVLETSVDVAAPGWYDEDLPLMYKFSYRVVGKRPQPGIPADGPTPLTSDFVPLGSPYSMAVEMPERGEPDHGFAVEISVSVLDSMGAAATAATNMTVVPLPPDVEVSLLNEKVHHLLQNGDIDRAMRFVQGISIAMNEELVSEQFSESAADRLAALEQMRENLMNITVQIQHMVAPTTSSVEGLAGTGNRVVSVPSQVNSRTLGSGLGLFADLVEWTLSSATEAVITDTSTCSIINGLGHLTLATKANHLANANGDVDARMSVLQSAAAATASATSAQLAVAPAEECRAAATALGFVSELAAVEAEAAGMAASNAAVTAEVSAIIVRSEHGSDATSAARASQAAMESAQAGVVALDLARAAEAVIKHGTEEPTPPMPPPFPTVAASEATATVTAQYRFGPSLELHDADPTFQASISESIGARILSLPPQISVHWAQDQGGRVQVAATAPMATLEAARQSALNLSHPQAVFSGNILVFAHAPVETEGIHFVLRATLMDSTAALVVRYRFEPSVLSIEDALTEALLAALELEIATAVGATSSNQVATTRSSLVPGVGVVLAVRIASVTRGEALRQAEMLSQPSVAVFLTSEGSEIAKYHPALDSLEVALKAREEPKAVVEAAYRFAGRLTLSNAGWTLQRSVAESVAAAVALVDVGDVRSHWAEQVAADGREVVEIHVQVDLAHAQDASAVARQLFDAAAVFAGSAPPVAAYLPADATLIRTTLLENGGGAGASSDTVLLQVVYRFSDELDVGTATGILFGKQVGQGVGSALGGSSGVRGEVSVRAVELFAPNAVEMCVSVLTSGNSSDDLGRYLPTLTSLSDGASVFAGISGVSKYTPVGVATRIILPTGGLHSTALLPSASSLAQGKPYIQATARYRFGAELSMADAVGEEFLHGLVACVASASELPMNMTAVMSVTMDQDVRVVVTVVARTDDVVDSEVLVRMTLALSDAPKVLSHDSRLRRHARSTQSLGVEACLEDSQPAVGVDHHLRVHYNLGLGRWGFDDAALEGSRASVEAAARVHSPSATVRVLALATDDAQMVSVGYTVDVDSQRTHMDLLLSALSDSQAVFALGEIVPSNVITIKVGTAEHPAVFPEAPPASVNVTYAFGPELSLSHVDSSFLENTMHAVASAAAVPISSVAITSLQLTSDNTVAISVHVAIIDFDASVVCANTLSDGTAVFGTLTATGQLFTSVTLTSASVITAATPEDRSMRDTGVTVTAVYRFGESLAVTTLDEMFLKRVRESVHIATAADVSAVQHAWIDADLRVLVRVEVDAMDAVVAAAYSRILQDAQAVFSAQEEVSRHAPLAVEVTTTPYGALAPPPLPPAPPSPDAEEVARQEELGRIAIAAAESSRRATEAATSLATEAAEAAAMANFSSQALAVLEARAVNGTRNSTVPSPGDSYERHQRAVAVTTEALGTVQSVGTSLLLGVVPGERHQECGTNTLSMRVQRDRSDLSSSPLYDPIIAPAGTSAAGALFPPSLGSALAAAAVGPAGTNTTALEALVVDVRLVTTITEAHLPGDNATKSNVVAGVGITSLSILTPDGVEISVANLHDPVEVSIALAPEFAQGHTAGLQETKEIVRPPVPRTVSSRDMAAVSPEDVLASKFLFAIMVSIVGAALYFAVVMSWKDLQGRMEFQANLGRRYGTGRYSCKRVGRLWIWGILEEARDAQQCTLQSRAEQRLMRALRKTEIVTMLDIAQVKYPKARKRRGIIIRRSQFDSGEDIPETNAEKGAVKRRHRQRKDSATTMQSAQSGFPDGEQSGFPDSDVICDSQQSAEATPQDPDLNDYHLAFVGISGSGRKVVALEEALCPELSRREKASVLFGGTGYSNPSPPELTIDATTGASEALAKVVELLTQAARHRSSQPVKAHRSISILSAESSTATAAGEPLWGDALAQPALIEPEWTLDELRWSAAWANLSADEKTLVMGTEREGSFCDENEKMLFLSWSDLQSVLQDVWEKSVEEDTRKVTEFALRSGLLEAPAAGLEEMSSSSFDRRSSRLGSIDQAHIDPLVREEILEVEDEEVDWDDAEDRLPKGDPLGSSAEPILGATTSSAVASAELSTGSPHEGSDSPSRAHGDPQGMPHHDMELAGMQTQMLLSDAPSPRQTSHALHPLREEEGKEEAHDHSSSEESTEEEVEGEEDSEGGVASNEGIRLLEGWQTEPSPDASGEQQRSTKPLTPPSRSDSNGSESWRGSGVEGSGSPAFGSADQASKVLLLTRAVHESGSRASSPLSPSTMQSTPSGATSRQRIGSLSSKAAERVAAKEAIKVVTAQDAEVVDLMGVGKAVRLALGVDASGAVVTDAEAVELAVAGQLARRAKHWGELQAAVARVRTGGERDGAFEHAVEQAEMSAHQLAVLLKGVGASLGTINTVCSHAEAGQAEEGLEVFKRARVTEKHQNAADQRATAPQTLARRCATIELGELGEERPVRATLSGNARRGMIKLEKRPKSLRPRKPSVATLRRYTNSKMWIESVHGKEPPLASQAQEEGNDAVQVQVESEYLSLQQREERQIVRHRRILLARLRLAKQYQSRWSGLGMRVGLLQYLRQLQSAYKALRNMDEASVELPDKQVWDLIGVQRRRRIAVKLKVCAVFIVMQWEAQDLHHSENLLEMMGSSLGQLQLNMPMPEMRKMANRSTDFSELCKSASDDWVRNAPANTNHTDATETEYEKSISDITIPIERLLGTALLMAYLMVKKVLDEDRIKQQLHFANTLNWETPLKRSMGYYTHIFTVSVGLPGASDESEMCSAAVCDNTNTMHQLWATLCAIERYKKLPFKWIINPEAPAAEHRTLEDLAEDSVQARAVVDIWHAEHLSNLALFRKASQEEMKRWDKLQTDWERRAKHIQQWKELWRTLCFSHPWVSIWMASFLDPFSRTQRVVVQANNMLVMLMVQLMLFYSKGTTECDCYREHLGCSALATGEPCWGESTCLGLFWQRDQGLLPDHLDPNNQECFGAFPDPDSWRDRAWSSLISVVIMLPIARTFSALFTIGGSPVIPRSLRHKPSARWQKVFGEPNMARIEMLWFVILTILFDQQHLGQAFSIYFQYITRSVDEDMEVQQEYAIRRQEMLSGVASVFRIRNELDSLLVRVCYIVIGVWWITLVWLLITYSTLIRNMLGKSAESQILRDWLIALMLDTFGMHIIKTFTADMLFYEEYVYKKLGLHYSLLERSQGAMNRTMDEGIFSVNNVQELMF